VLRRLTDGALRRAGADVAVVAVVSDVATPKVEFFGAAVLGVEANARSADPGA
jgi:hypothetical protein